MLYLLLINLLHYLLFQKARFFLLISIAFFFILISVIFFWNRNEASGILMISIPGNVHSLKWKTPTENHVNEVCRKSSKTDVPKDKIHFNPKIHTNSKPLQSKPPKIYGTFPSFSVTLDCSPIRIFLGFSSSP